MRRRRRLGPLFGLGAAMLCAALSWVSYEMLQLERAETKAREEAGYQESLRLALWRLDNKVAVLLAKEAARPHEVYRSFYFPQQAYTKEYQKIQSKEVLTPSPLLDSKPEFIQLHFQVDGAGNITSPQVPEGNVLDTLELPPEALAARRTTLERVRGLVELPELRKQVAAAEANTKKWAVPSQRRGQTASIAKGLGEGESATIGPLEPIWRGRELLFVRRVQVGEERFFQGFLADWPRLRAELLAEIADLFPAAELRPVVDTGQTDRMLFTLPLALQAPRAASSAGQHWTATHTVLAIAWTVVGLAGVGAWLALRRSQEFGEKQRRFASLVTHELRSPLTTFRLYSDLLAEGMVTESEKTGEYHRTLQKESDQMARMVENVITHSRLEEGRTQLRREAVLVGNVLEQAHADLERCCAKAGLALSVDAGAARDTTVETDPAVVGQILFNLVENACKYGRSDDRPTVLVGASVADGVVKLSVRDHGPGIPPNVQRRIFRPFERGGRDETDPVRGLGLGLALCQGLARDLGGELTLEHPPDGGARFVLSLPA